jgi:DNA-dependent protein kinase catalytic subunit
VCYIYACVYFAGAMLLEGLLGQSSVSQPHGKRSKTATDALQELRDVRFDLLAKMYGKLEDSDMNLILSTRFSRTTHTISGIQRFLQNDFKGAENCYRDGQNEDEEENNAGSKEKDFWEDQVVECIRRQLDWTDLRRTVTVEIDDDVAEQPDEKWAPADPLELWNLILESPSVPYLSYYVTSSLKLAADASDREVSSAALSEVFAFVSAADGASDKKTLLEATGLRELTLLHALRGDKSNTGFYHRKCLVQFIDQWSVLHSRADETRLKLLQTQQPLVEAAEFVDLLVHDGLHCTDDDMLDKYAKRLSVWSDRLPLVTDPVEVWDDVVQFRLFYLDVMSANVGKLTASLGDMTTPLKERCFELQRDLSISAVDFMREEARTMSLAGGFNAALKVLDRANQKASSKYAPAVILHLELELDRLEVEHRQAIAQLDQKSMKACLLHLVQRVDALQFAEQDALESQARLFKGVVYADIVKYAVGDEEDAAQAFEHLHSLFNDVQNALNADGSSKTGHSALLIPITKGGVPVAIRLYRALAAFCAAQLDELERKEGESLKDLLSGSEQAQQYGLRLTEAVLGGMAFGCTELEWQFPRVLEVAISSGDVIQRVFTNYTQGEHAVPLWKVIKWIPQMLAALSTGDSCLVEPILADLALAYPQAMCFPFHMTNAVVRQDEAKARKLGDSLESIGQHLTNKLVTPFVTALDTMTDPLLVFADLGKRLKYLLFEALPARKEDAVKEFQRFRADYITDVSPLAGRLQREYAKHWRKVKFLSQFDEKKGGVAGSQLLHMTPKEFLAAMKVGTGILPSKLQHVAIGTVALSEYNLWMEGFERLSEAAGGDYLELPGQYGELVSAPRPEQHVRMIGFDRVVRVMNSIRKPKRVAIRGNNERSYNYLVKGGEDLRLDQRIEQLFGIMNSIYASDKSCSERSLKLKTYQVVPLSDSVGILEWLDNTQPLIQLFASEYDLANVSQKVYDMMFDVNCKYSKKASNPIFHNAGAQGQLYLGVPADEVRRVFQDSCALLPPNLLARALLRLATEPSHFLVMRRNFLRSMGVLSVSCYLCGIGDRHLGNFLMCNQTGQGTLLRVCSAILC